MDRMFLGFRDIVSFSFLLCLFFLSPLAFSAELMVMPLKFHFNEQLREYSHLGMSRLFQDSSGFIWIGTTNGLLKFDGMSVKHFRHDEKDDHSISSNAITDIVEDHTGRLWITTYGGGLNKYSPETETFKRFTFDEADNKTLSSDNLWDAVVTADMELWLGSRNWLSVVDLRNETIRRLNPQEDPSFPVANNNIWTTQVSNDRSTIWIATLGEGVYSYNLITGKYQNYKNTEDSNSSLSNNLVRSVLEDSRGRIWVGTDHGLNMIHADRRRVSQHLNASGIPTSLSNNSVNKLFEDRNDHLWVGTYGGGLNMLPEGSDQFIRFTLTNQFTSKEATIVTDILEDSSGILWFATDQGVFQLNPLAFSFNHLLGAPVLAFLERRNGDILFSSENHLYQLLQDNSYKLLRPKIPRIVAMEETEDGDLWLGSYGEGLINISTGQAEITKQINKTNSILPTNKISSLYLDKNGALWCGLNSDGGSKGLLKYDLATDKTTLFLERYNVVEILALNDNELILATVSFGLIKFHTQTHESELLSQGSQGERNLIFAAKSVDGIWFGTYSVGLGSYSSKSDSFAYMDLVESVGSNKVEVAATDRYENLWIATDAGVGVLDREKNTILSLDVNDGLYPLNINPRAVLSTSDGDILFGSQEGLVRFSSSDVLDGLKKNVISKVVLTDFKLFNRPVKLRQFDEESPLFESIGSSEEITLAHSDRLFSLGFAALDYRSPTSTKYRYKLAGFDDRWVETSSSLRVATYTSLLPGSYLFSVAAAPKNGTWSPSAKVLKITISPPFWFTWQARLFYILASLAMVYGIISARTAALRKKSEELEIAVHERTNELLRTSKKLEATRDMLEEYLQQKNRFFENISHEFRTPLTLILNPAEKMLKRSRSENNKKWLSTILYNSKRLLRMVDQLLLLSVAENSDDIHYTLYDVEFELRSIVDDFEALFNEKNIALMFEFSSELKTGEMVSVPQETLQTVFLNLLSNALKFTPENESVEVVARCSNRSFEMSVTNTGAFLNPSDQAKVFARFERVQGDSEYVNGTGIGLSLVKQTLEKAGGTISVSSSMDSGTSFDVFLPVNRQEPQYLLSRKRTQSRRHEIGLELASLRKQSEDSTDLLVSKTDKRPIVLVVEDNFDMRQLLVDCLTPRYQCLVARDGDEGIAKANEHLPDIIITDLMMPETNGYQVAEAIRGDRVTCHIPIVVLTAKGDFESKILGWRKNVDDYMVKPFRTEELQTRLESLLEIRKILKIQAGNEIIKSNPAVLFQGSGYASKDQKFINGLEEVMHENYKDPEFSREQAAQHLSMSTRQLNRKIGGLFDFNFSEYLKRYRLRQALPLIEEGKTQFAISLDVGFSSHTYFSKCFRDVYGMTVKQYQQKMADVCD